MPEGKRWSEMEPDEKRFIRKELNRQDQEKRHSEHRANAGFEPLKITAKLQTPVISDRSLPLDAILYYVHHRDQFGRQEFTTPGVSNEIGGGSLLPLERCATHSPMWFYAASWAQWDGAVAEGMDHWNRRFDSSLTDYLDMPKAKLDIAAGRYKSYHMPVFTRHALSVHWHVVGHKESIGRLLRFVTHIGKKGSQGYGAVLDWSIEASEDLSVRGADGRAMRAIPDGKGILIGFRPSYWNSTNQALCEVPG